MPSASADRLRSVPNLQRKPSVLGGREQMLSRDKVLRTRRGRHV